MNIFNNDLTATENITCYMDRVLLGKLTGLKIVTKFATF